MKNSCQIVRDLIPLYADGVASEESRKMVDDHIAECEVCRECMRELQGVLPEQNRQTAEEEESLFREEIQKLLRKRRMRVLRSVIAGIAVGVALLLAFSIGKYHLYENAHAKNMETTQYQLQMVQLQSGKKILAGKTLGNLFYGGYHLQTVFAEDGRRILNINVRTSVIPRYAQQDTMLLFDLENWEYDAVYAGKHQERLIWQTGQPVAAASEELEKYFALEKESALLRAEVNYLNEINEINGVEDTEADNWLYLEAASEKVDQLQNAMKEMKNKAPEWQ